jgi:ParB family transcriptional regulator, chromosome partitioning protein
LKIKISDINIGPRFRKDLGDLGPLVDSIKRHGLLHPVVIDESNSLICGRRRIAAIRKLGEFEIEANVISSTNPKEAEADENNCRLNFTVSEIADVDDYLRNKIALSARVRMLAGKKIIVPCGNFPQGQDENHAQGEKTRDIIAKKCNITGRTLEKIRTIKKSSTEGDFPKNIWAKVASGKMKVDKGYNQIKKFQRINEAQKLASSSRNSISDFDLKLGPIQEKGLEIADNSVDLILTDPPYNEESIPLYGELAKLAQRVLKPGGSLITIIGHYALFKIGKQITDNSELEYHWQLILKHNGHTAKTWKQRVWPKYKPMLWYYKRSGNGNTNGQGPTMYSDIEDLIESQPPEKTMHDWE